MSTLYHLNMINKVIAITLLIFITSCAWVKVERATDTNKIKHQHYFALPKLIMEITIPVEKTVYTKAVPSTYALLETEYGSTAQSNQIIKFDSIDLIADIERLVSVFGIKRDVINKLSNQKSVQSFKIGKPQLKFSNMIDESKIFIIQPKSFFAKQNINITHSNAGVLKTLDISTDILIDDYVVSGLSAIGSVVAAARGTEGKNKARDEFVNPNLKELDKLIGHRNELIYNDGNVITDKGVYDDQLKKINQSIQKILAKYVYSSQTSKSSITVMYKPETHADVPIDNQILFLVNKSNGSITPNCSLNEQLSIFYSWKINNCVNIVPSQDSDLYYIKFTKERNSFYDLVGDKLPSNLGYPYNVPRNTVVELSKIALNRSKNKTSVDASPIDNFDTTRYYHNRIKVPQFGKIAYLSRKQSKAVISYDSLTGEIRTVSSINSSNNSENVATFGTSTQLILEALKSDDEVTRLEREAKVLELKKKIKELSEEE